MDGCGGRGGVGVYDGESVMGWVWCGRYVGRVCGKGVMEGVCKDGSYGEGCSEGVLGEGVSGGV